MGERLFYTWTNFPGLTAKSTKTLFIAWRYAHDFPITNAYVDENEKNTNKAKPWISAIKLIITCCLTNWSVYHLRGLPRRKILLTGRFNTFLNNVVNSPKGSVIFNTYMQWIAILILILERWILLYGNKRRPFPNVGAATPESASFLCIL